MGRQAELSEAAWARIEPLMPQAAGRSRPWRDHRQVVEGIVHRYRTGLPWRDLPERFGPWQTVWKRHHRFSVDGTWDKLLAVLQSEADREGVLDWRVSVDSSVIRAHQHGATARREASAALPGGAGGGGELQEDSMLQGRTGTPRPR
jgi:transposase